MENGLVSIITPMYNGSEFIGDTIASVLAQSYQNWEMIIVDDCSSDDAASIKEVKKFNDGRIILIESKINLGSSGARNIALKRSHGEYIAFLDSDDIWESSFLDKQLKFMQENSATLVFSSYNRIDEHTKENILRPFIVPQCITYKSLLKTCPIFPSSVVYDLRKCEKYFFNEKMGSLRDDYVYWLTMLKDIKYGYGNTEILVNYRMRKTSVTGNKMKVIKPQWKVLRRIENLSLPLCVYYIICWSIISYFKYRK